MKDKNIAKSRLRSRSTLKPAQGISSHMNRKMAAAFGLVLLFSAGCGTAQQGATTEAMRLVDSLAPDELVVYRLK